MKLSTVRLLVANGANYTIANNRGETAIAIAQSLQPDQQENFLNALVRKFHFSIHHSSQHDIFDK